MDIQITILAGIVLLIILLLAVIFLLIRPTERSSPAQQDQIDPEPLDQNYSQLALGDVESPLAVIEPFEPPAGFRLEPLPVSEQQRDHLQTIFRHAPSLAKSALTTTSKTYALRFSPEATRNIANGSWKIMESTKGGLHGVAVDAHGKIVAQGTLVPASIVKMVGITTAIFQCLAIVTAQYYLPQINRRLERIEQGIQDIKAHLETRDWAILVSSLKQLKPMTHLLDKGDFQESDRVNLDAIDRDCGGILEAYREHMERYKSELDELKLAGVFNPDFVPATDKYAQHEKATLICLQAMYVKSVTAQFRCALPSDGRIAQAHRGLQELGADLEAWHTDRTAFAQRFEERIQNDTTPSFDLGGATEELFGDDDTLSTQRKEIIDEANERQEPIIALHDELNQTINRATAHAAQQLSASSEPLTLVVTLNDQNEIEQVSKRVA